MSSDEFTSLGQRRGASALAHVWLDVPAHHYNTTPHDPCLFARLYQIHSVSHEPFKFCFDVTYPKCFVANNMRRSCVVSIGIQSLSALCWPLASFTLLAMASTGPTLPD